MAVECWVRVFIHGLDTYGYQTTHWSIKDHSDQIDLCGSNCIDKRLWQPWMSGVKSFPVTKYQWYCVLVYGTLGYLTIYTRTIVL